MRFETYKRIVDMAYSICEAVAYVKQSEEDSVLSVCLEALEVIKATLEAEQNTHGHDKIFGLISEITALINNEGFNSIDDIAALAMDLYYANINNLAYKVRVLIVAELGGKWDSLASVYEALKKRDDCEVEVVIEPVYRAVKLPDGSVRSDVVLEDYLTPMGIENIPYQQYDIAISKPDITFYSQPYDGCTVPMFRTENLAKYSRLVYCPYFSADTIDKKISSAHDSFFKLPAQQLCWKIACQSEQMERYYGIYASRKGENVISCGIPKWDYPMKLNKENTPCPDGWSEKIAGRSVILWNSHFVTINMSANSNTELFGYEKQMLELFRNNKNAVLLWRPHPMSATVLKVASPDKYYLYQKLLDEAVACDNVIVDLNPTYDSSFVWSDALISDYSSLITQYIMMDKPYAMLAKTDDKSLFEMFYTADGLLDFSKIRKLCGFDKIKCFIEEICNNTESNSENRKYIRDNFFKLADGMAGERFVKDVINNFYEEAFPASTEQDEEAALLVIGSAKDAVPCIGALKEKGVRYFLCNDYMEDVDTGDETNLISINDISDKQFDFVIIADKNRESIISRLLTAVYGISADKIISFWRLYNASLPVMVCDRVMMNPKVQQYEGIVLGISHTEVGIMADKLKAPFCNLSVSSQDIFYQLKTLQHCIENYPEKLKNLKYAIVDLYDYKYFNYDTSLSVSAVNYISYGGYNSDAHNFANNKNYPSRYDDYVSRFKAQRLNGIADWQIELWNELFSDAYKYADYKGFCGNFNVSERFKEVNERDIDGYSYTGGSAKKLFPETIEENKKLIRVLFDTLKSINKDIKIYTIVVPKYIETEVRQAEAIAKFVNGFKGIVEELHNEYDFTMLDFNEISDISMNKTFYYDAAHLNYFGAKYLTERLNEIIFN